MPSYLIQLSYGPEAVAAFVKRPQDRREVIQKLLGQIGGTLVGSWMSFGEFDAVLIVDGADNIGAAAVSMAVTATGAFKAFRTTPLLSAEEAMDAMKKAGKLNYKPPSGKK
jgi:uncharacterized protein with GYD domain